MNCKMSSKAFSEANKLLGCIRCEGMFCTDCSGFTISKMAILRDAATGASWFCPPCHKITMKNVKEEKDLDDKCKEYMAKFEKS